MNILLLGDIVGPSGRKAITENELKELKRKKSPIGIQNNLHKLF